MLKNDIGLANGFLSKKKKYTFQESRRIFVSNCFPIPISPSGHDRIMYKSQCETRSNSFKMTTPSCFKLVLIWPSGSSRRINTHFRKAAGYSFRFDVQIRFPQTIMIGSCTNHDLRPLQNCSK